MRNRGLAALLALLLAGGTARAAPPARDGSRDFDFETGRWATELWRLKKPLDGSPEWERYTGTTVVTPVWAGKANMVELEVDGPRGHLEALSLRLYDRHAARWTLNYANASSGALSLPPSVGSFSAAGVGEFHSVETADGRAVIVRFVITPLGPAAIRFEQSYSADGGRSWELNWIATDRKLP